jgi:hypothetical protein
MSETRSAFPLLELMAIFGARTEKRSLALNRCKKSAFLSLKVLFLPEQITLGTNKGAIFNTFFIEFNVTGVMT